MADLINRASRVLRHSMYVRSVRCFFVFYILVGLPTGFQGRYLPLYFRTQGMSLTKVGMYRLLVLPWLLKGVWSSYITRETDVRRWLNISLALLVVLCLIAANVKPTDTVPVICILFGLNFITSVQDTAIDSLLMDAFTPSQLLMGNVAQAVGERFGAVISGGIFTWYITVLPWSSVFHVMAGLYAMGLVTSYFMLPDLQMDSASSRSGSTSTGATSALTERHGSRVDSTISIKAAVKQFYTEASMWMIIFVLFYKIGEVGVYNLLPLFFVDQGIQASDVGFWLGIVGQSVAIIGSTSTAFFSFRTMMKPLTILMISRSVFVVLSWGVVVFWNRDPWVSYVTGIASMLMLSVAGGAITTCTQTLMMQLSQRAPRHERAKHYAIYSFGELLAKLLFASGVGALAQVTSYEFAFLLFTIATALVIPYIWVAPDHVYVRMDY